MGRAACTASSNWASFPCEARAAFTPAWIFSHTRGTPKKLLGRTWGRYLPMRPASGQVVTSSPPVMPR